MIKRLFFISIILSLFASCATQKQLTEEGPTISSKDYPYIESFHKALRYKATGRLPEAIVLLEKCLQIRQDDDAVYYALSKAELSLGNAEKSSIYIQKAAALDPNNLWYKQELAYMYFELGDFEKSVSNFKALVDAEPRNVDWLYGYAEALVRAGEAEKAIDALQKTEDQIGRYPDIIIQKHNLYVSLKKLDKAEQELLEAKKEFPKDPMIIATLVDFYFKQNQEQKAIGMLEELVAADPTNGRAHLTLADIYRQQGKEAQSYQELKLAFQSSDVDIDTKMHILIKIHESMYKIAPEIYEIVDILLEQYPEEAKAHSIKGDYMLRKQDEEAALKAYKEALKYDKGQYPIWNQVLIMQYQAAAYDELYSYSKECLEYFPTISTVYLLHGVACNQLKKFDEGLEALELGTELVLNDLPMKGEFLGQIGDANFGLKNTQVAIDSYKKAIKTSPESSLLKNNFAFQLAKHKVELELAESMIKQAIETSEDQAQYIDTYGWLLFQRGEYDQAEAKFIEANKLDPTDKLVLEHLGDVNFMLKKQDMAIKYWEQARDTNKVKTILEKKITDKKYYAPQD